MNKNKDVLNSIALINKLDNFLEREREKLYEKLMVEKIWEDFEMLVVPKIFDAYSKKQTFTEIKFNNTDVGQLYYVLHNLDNSAVEMINVDTLKINVTKIIHRIDKMENLKQVSVILAQILYEHLNGYSSKERQAIGENIIRFLYDSLTYSTTQGFIDAINEFTQHNEDCRYECYCCSSRKECGNNKYDPVSVDNSYLKEIIKILDSKNN